MIVLLTTRDKDNKEQNIRKEIIDAYTCIYFSHDNSPEIKANYFIQYLYLYRIFID